MTEAELKAQALDVWERLLRVSPDAEKDDEAKRRASVFIEHKLTTGWTATEIVAHMRWAEEFDPHVEEHVALREMKRVTDVVAARILSLRQAGK